MDASRRPSRPAGFETIEHTADIGLHVWGRSAEELFQQAGLGLVALIVKRAGGEAPGPHDEREVAVSSTDLEEALISFLQELLYLFEIGRFVAVEITVEEAGPTGVRARLRGEARDPARHEALTDVKAATYHDLSIVRDRDEDRGETWSTVIIFDI
jgi:SHS2 domain-containing protein